MQRATLPFWSAGFLALLPRLRQGAARNLARVLGPARDPLAEQLRVYRLFTNFCGVLADAHALYELGRVPLPVDVIGRERLERLVGRTSSSNGRAGARRGAILVTGHLGHWQLGAELLQRDGLPLTLVMVPEANAAAQAYVAARRDERYRVLYADGSPEVALTLLERLRQGELVAVQLDRHVLAGANGRVESAVELPFFGAPARFPVGPVLLARAAGVPLLPTFLVEEDGRCRVHVEEPVEVPRSADREADARQAQAQLVAVLERYVATYPYQWFTFSDFWASATTGRDVQDGAPAHPP